MSGDKGVYYFGYGPIINPLVRRRRNIVTSHEQAAFLPEHRLTFAYGGIANIVAQRGFEVHGVLMRFDSQTEWRQFQESDNGYNDMQILEVYLYETPDGPPKRAYCLTMTDFEESRLDRPPEQLPQERYLKLISSGLRCYNVDDDYVQDHILNVPYAPSRKPEEYLTFPKKSDKLPKISLKKYQQLCKSNKDIYFILDDCVFRLGPHDADHPGALWCRNNLHGNDQSTLILHRTIVDPNMEPVDVQEDLTQDHHAWAENCLLEFLGKCNLTAVKQYELKTQEVENSKRKQRGSWLVRVFSKKTELDDPSSNDIGLSQTGKSDDGARTSCSTGISDCHGNDPSHPDEEVLS